MPADVSFSPEWDQRYRENTQIAIWPWSDLVSHVRRNCRRLDAGSRVLELGCGAGANIPFFQSLGVQYHAVEGSESMVQRLHGRFPDLKERIVAGDFTLELPFETEFDLVVDRASLTHNDTAAILRCLDLVWRALRPGAHFIGIDWFSTQFSEFPLGPRDADPNTRGNYARGPFAGVGRVHFSDEAHLRELFARFEFVLLEEKVVRQFNPGGNEQFAAWNLVVRKPNV
jgi:SAM-dependent methyltransferase